MSPPLPPLENFNHALGVLLKLACLVSTLSSKSKETEGKSKQTRGESRGGFTKDKDIN